MMKVKSLISSICMVLIVLLATSTLVLSASATKNVYVDDTAKIDEILKSKLISMSNEDSIAVSVWFKDIDNAELRKNLVQKAEQTIGSDFTEISEDAIDLLYYDVDNSKNMNTKTLSELNATYSNVTYEELQAASQLERKIAAEMYNEHNQDIIDELFSSNASARETSLSSDNSSSNTIKYVCKYAPNVDMVLTKSQILDIIASDSVKEVNYRSTNATTTVIEALSTTEGSSVLNTTANTYDTSYFTATGLDTARDVWGLDGRNMHIGIIESSGVPIESLVGGTVDNIPLENYDDTSFHATQIALILVGNRTSTDENGNSSEMYTGAIPEATLHAVAVKGQVERLKPAVDALIAKGVSVISSSCGFYDSDISGAYYSDAAKWYDYISTNRNVHFALCAGNYRASLGPRQVLHSNNAYNAVVVGNCDNNGQLYTGRDHLYTEGSLYNDGSNISYKPDIVAPGVDTFTPVSNQAQGATGSSLSTPMVASAMIQLSQASSVLQANPTLMKAVLISSSKIKHSMSSEPMYSIANATNIAYSRPYGAGMLSVTNAYTVAITKGYYEKGSFSPYSTGVSYTKQITKSVGKTIRFCVTWDKVSTAVNEDEYSSIESNDLDVLTLKITTPSGMIYRSAY